MLTRAEMESLVNAKTWEPLDPKRKHAAQAPRKASKGVAHSLSRRMSDERVREIRETYAAWIADCMLGKRSFRSVSWCALSRQFGCGNTTARDIVRGWARVEAGGPIFDEPDA